MLRIVLLLYIVSFCLSTTSGQSDTLLQELDVIVIKDKRLEIPYSETSRFIDIIEKDQIENSPAQSLAELLQYVAGIDVRRRGVNGVQADISIRGGTFDQALVMINGVSMSDSQTGHHIMNLPLDLESIERIEILKGPGSRRYGHNAFSGAINVITKRNSDSPLRVNTGYSSNVTGQLGIQAFIPTAGASHSLSVSKSFSEGYRYNTDYELDNLFFQSEIDINGNNLIINGGYSNREFGANGFYASPTFTEQYEEVATSILSLKYGFDSKNWKITPSIYWRRNQDEYIFVRSNPSLYRNLHIGNSYVTEINASQFNSLGVLGIGTELRIDDLQSNNLGERSRTTFGFNIEQRFNLWNGNIDVTPGIAIYSYSDFGTRAFPGIDAGVNISREFKVFGNVGSTWRVPTYTDLYYSDPANLGNPDLEPETAITYEIGTKWLGNNLSVTASGFVRNSNNLIDWTKENEDDPWFPSNIGSVKVKGWEMSGKYKMGNSAHSPFLSFGYTYLDGENNIDASISRYALDLINHQFIIGFEYAISESWRHVTYFRMVDRLNLDNYSLVDTRLSFVSGLFGFSLYINNLLDKEYTETNLVPMPGRWIGLSVHYRLK